MRSLKYFLRHNWFQKLFALVLATLLWMTVAAETSSEIGMDVPLEYRNIPKQLEITGEATKTVEVRLRGSSNLIKQISPRDVSTTIDLGTMKAGERILILTPANVQAPFGAEVVRVNPSQVRLSLELTATKSLPVVATVQGQPAVGYEVRILLNPSKVQVEGPASRLKTLESIPTAPIRVDERKSGFQQSVDLDLPDPQVRLQHAAPVEVRVEVRRKTKP